MRVRVPLLAYAVASFLGAAIHMFLVSLMETVKASDVFFGTILFWIGGGILGTPVAVPAIIATERWGKGPCWFFLSLGAGSCLGVLALIAQSGWTTEQMIALLVAAIVASGAYWFFAWHLFPPQKEIESIQEVFE